MRQVSRRFDRTLTPPLFTCIAFYHGPKRHAALTALADAPHLAEHIRTLRLACAPRDFGKDWADEIHGYPPRERARYYFDDLQAWLAPRLKRFPALRTLHLGTSYDGLHLAGTSRGELLMPCFDALCAIVRAARPFHLETVQVELPYEGGYPVGFFQETGARLGGVSESLVSASVKLRDWQDNYTIMPIRL